MAKPILCQDTRGGACSGCALNAAGVPLAQMGEDSDHDSRTAWLCFRCLQLGIEVLSCPECNDVEKECGLHDS